MVFKGTREVVIQDIKLQSHNTKFVLKRYYSPSENRYFDAPLPAGYGGSEFGPGLRAYIHMLYFQARVTQNKIEKILSGIGIEITDSEICRILNQPKADLKNEQEEARIAALKKCNFVQLDDTGARIFDLPAYTIVTSNRYYCEYLTTQSKDRLNVIKALSGEREVKFLVNRVSLSILRERIAQKYWKTLSKIKGRRLMSREKLERKIKGMHPIPNASIQEIYSACAIAAYRAQERNRPKILVSDDATNFKGLFRHHQLCWVHEMRHYRVLPAFGAFHEELIRDHLDEMSQLYRRIQNYQKHPPDPDEKRAIETRFDEIFGKKTPFNALNQELLQSRKRKKGLLTALNHPQIPLHNNESETDLRERVLKRRISYGNRSWAGVRSWDLQLGLVHTTRKLNVSYWEFLKDRFEKKYAIPPLRNLILTAA